MTQTVERTAASLADRIAELVRQDEVQLPPLPEVALRLQQMLANEAVSTKQVAALLQADPAVVAALLRVANSSAYGGLHKVSDLNQAITRLGLRQVGTMVTALKMKGHFAHEGAEKRALLQTLWDHSVTSAFAARVVAERVGADGEQAFLAGLLHDCGKLLVLKAMDHLEQRGLELTPTRALLEDLMDQLHPELGFMVLSAWELPEPVAQAARDHHQEVKSADAPLLLCVQAADLITRKLGFHLHPDPQLLLLQEPVVECLGLNDMMLATLMIDLEDRLHEMRRLF